MPKSYAEMKRGENSVQFLDAVNHEVHGLIEAGAFEVVDEQERIENCVGSKLVFDWKVDAFGFATKSKARLVARGDMQREFVDFAYLYAPTVATSSIRLLAAFANEYDLELCHVDVDQAFVRADLKEDVFMLVI